MGIIKKLKQKLFVKISSTTRRISKEFVEKKIFYFIISHFKKYFSLLKNEIIYDFKNDRILKGILPLISRDSRFFFPDLKAVFIFFILFQKIFFYSRVQMCKRFFDIATSFGIFYQKCFYL